MIENLDLICIGEGLIELSSDESLSYANQLKKFYGGDTICTAVAAARLGSKVGFVSRVGTDFFKDFLIESWQMEDIDTSQIKLVEGFNALYFITRPSNKAKEFAYYRRKSAATNLSIDDISPSYIEKASIVYSTGITQSLSISSAEAVKKAFQIAREKCIKVAYDPNYSPLLQDVSEAKESFEDVIDYVDIMFLNAKHDALELFDLDSPEKIIKYLNDRGVSMVVVKQGAEGYTVGYNGEIAHIEAITENLVDSTNSGDAFNGAFLHGISSGLTPFESCRLASLVVKYQVQGIGAINSMPHKEDVYAEFKNFGN
ncbi:MAG: sugar kinase [Candidatus Gastranaerophilales bacterium]|nr:sugar kinase [Candidatus Gastranaerophilales bacterium]